MTTKSADIKQLINAGKYDEAIQSLSRLEKAAYPKRDEWIARVQAMKADQEASELEANILPIFNERPSARGAILPVADVNPFDCPRCGNPATNDVAHIVESGTVTSQTQHTTRGTWTTEHDKKTTSFDTTMTGIASKLSHATNKKLFFAEIVERVGLTLSALAGIALFCGSSPSKFGAILGLIAFSVVLHFLPPMQHARARQAEAYQRWEQSRYCGNCGSVFVEGEPLAVKSSQMQGLIYLQPGQKQKRGS